MPKELIPEEDRFSSVDEIRSSWSALSRYLCELPASISESAASSCEPHIADLLQFDRSMVQFDGSPLLLFYTPRVTVPWWLPGRFERPGSRRGDVSFIVRFLRALLLRLCTASGFILKGCASKLTPVEKGETLLDTHLQKIETTDATSAQLFPNRFVHRMATLQLFIVRSMPRSWLQSKYGSAGEVESDLYGLFPCPGIVDEPKADEEDGRWRVGYVRHFEPHTGVSTLVPLTGQVRVPSRCCVLEADLGHKLLNSVARWSAGVGPRAGSIRVQWWSDVVCSHGMDREVRRLIYASIHTNTMDHRRGPGRSR